MIEDCTAIILAGGESKRMGEDKAALILDGKQLLQHVIDILKPLFDHIVVSVRKPIGACEYPQFCDDSHDKGPMMGVAASLQQVKTNWVFVVAVDMPFISPDLIRFLAGLRAEKQVIVPMVNGFEQPLLAYYHKSCLPMMQQQIAGGNRSLRDLIAAVDRLIVKKDEIERFDEKMMSFYDLDCQEDLKYAKKHIGK